MASIQINRGTAQQINSTPITDGLINFDTTNNAIFLDNQSTREIFGNATDANVQETADSTLNNIKIKGHTYSAVGSFNGRSGQVSPQAGDYAIENITPTNAQDGQVPVAREDEHGNISFEMEDIVIDIPVEDLNDVDISNIQNGQILKYNSTSNKWENANDSGGSIVSVTQRTSTGTNIADITVDGITTQLFAPTSGGASSLSGLSDVNVASVTDGQALIYDSTSNKWVNETLNIVDDINDLNDVAISSATNGQVLTYNSTSGKWENANAQSGGFTDRTFNVASTSWIPNQDSTTNTDYPYVANITTAYYSNNSKPIWQMNGVGTIPTLAEQEEIGYILEAVFSSSGIILYAIDEPSVALVLEVKGD